jgi:hypothetical protein
VRPGDSAEYTIQVDGNVSEGVSHLILKRVDPMEKIANPFVIMMSTPLFLKTSISWKNSMCLMHLRTALQDASRDLNSVHNGWVEAIFVPFGIAFSERLMTSA